MANVLDSYQPPLGTGPVRRWTRADAYATGATRVAYAPPEWEAAPGFRLLILLTALADLYGCQSLHQSAKPAPPWLLPGGIAVAALGFALAAGLTAFVQLRMSCSAGTNL